jgi:HEAT repeat protein
MAPGTGSRSDDWTTGDITVEVEAGFEELDTLAPTEISRFHEEFAAEHEVSLMTTALSVAHAYLDSGITPEDRLELAHFVPRMLRLAIGEGSWLEAREALTLLRECGSEEWSAEGFTQELFQPISITATVELLDRQRSGQVAEFVALARELGEQAPEWLNLVLAASQNRVTRRVLAEAVALLCRDNPERIAPWLADPSWFVVRNAVQILGWIGGDAVVGLLATAARHPDRRVRYEVVGALASVPPEQVRPLLLEMLSRADTRMFCAILHQLAFERDTATAVLLVGFFQEADFEQRPDAEKRAIYSAIAAVGTDDILLELEAELAKGNWLAQGADAHRQAIARCVARIGTPRAHALLERGAEAKRAGVRTACAEALRMLHVRD